jgi:hypothetical protein
MSALSKRPVLAKDYEAFFKVLEDQQGTVRKNLRLVRERGYIGNEGDLKNLAGTVKNVVGAHNSFIESVNKGR